MKPENILADPFTGLLQICDFWFTNTLQQKEQSTTNVGTKEYL
jgi:serine/threonine protein kinase